MELHFTPLPNKYEFKRGVLHGKPYYAQDFEGPLYEGISEELGTTGSLKVCFCEALDDEYSNSNEGFVLSISKNGIEVHASKPEGHFYGALTLMKVVRQFGEDLPYVTIWDKPDVEFRCGAMESLHGMRFVEKWAFRWVRKLAYAGANHMFINFEIYTFLPEMRQYYHGEFNPDDARRLVAYAAKYNIRIMPIASVQGHYNEVLGMQYYNDIRETMEDEETEVTDVGSSICPNNPKAMDFVTRVIDIMVDIFHPDIYMLGGDEIYQAGGDAACRDQMKAMGKTGIILANFIKFRDYLEAKGIKTAIWGDMIISVSGENRYDGTIEKDQFRQSNLFLLEKLKRNTVIFDWWYTGESEKSQKFFADLGYDVVACTSTHACMMHFASPHQQINMWKLFRGVDKYHLYGGMVTDWINMFGYQTEQTLFNHYAGLSMLWRGTDENFIRDVTRERFERDYFKMEYHADDDDLREYFHLAGDPCGDMLKLFSPKNKGVSLRKAFFYDDDPLKFFLKYNLDLKGKLELYESAVKRLESLWTKLSAKYGKDEYFEALHMPTLLNRYHVDEFKIMGEMYKHYELAAKHQITDKKKFRMEMDKAIEVLSGLKGKSKDLLEFYKYMQRTYGLYDMTDMRISARENNIVKMIEYFESLKEDKYPIMVLKLVSEYLFKTPEDDWWKERFYDIGEYGGKFATYDVDRGMFYESIDWSYPLNK